jgi:hypothetical protein
MDVAGGKHQVFTRDDLSTASVSGVTTPPGATTIPFASGLEKVLTCLSDSNVGSQTIFPRLP